MKQLILICLCLALLVSCREGSKQDLALLHEASLHTAQPDSVLNLLGQIARPNRLRGKARADYALLYTEARNKQNRIGTDDSLIQVALGYYHKQAPGIPLAKSYFLLGRIYQQQGNDTLALKTALQALAALPPRTPDRTRMLVNYDLGRLYHKKGFYPQALSHYREMQHYIDAHPDTTDCYTAAYCMGNVFMMLNQYDSAYHYYQGAITLARQLKNKSYERYILEQLHLHARLTGNQKQAQWYAEEIRITTDPYLKAELFQELENTDSASFYFLKATKDPRISARAMAFYNLFQLHRKSRPDLACIYVDSFHIYKDSLYALRQTDKIEKLTAQYLQQMNQQKAEADRRENAIYLWGGIGITLLLCVIVIILFVKHRERRYLLLEKQLTASKLESLKEYVAIQAKQAPDKWEHFYRQIEQIEIRELIQKFQATVWHKRINALQREDALPFSPKERKLLTKDITTIFSLYVTQLQTEIPNIKSVDIMFCLLSLMGYRLSAIASCLGKKEHNLSMHKYRLKQKLEKRTFAIFFENTVNQNDKE